MPGPQQALKYWGKMACLMAHLLLEVEVNGFSWEWDGGGKRVLSLEIVFDEIITEEKRGSSCPEKQRPSLPKHCWEEHEGTWPCPQTSPFLPLLWMMCSGTLLNRYMCSLECPGCLFLLAIQSQLECQSFMKTFPGSQAGLATQSLSWLPQHTELTPVYSTSPGLLWYFLLVSAHHMFVNQMAWDDKDCHHLPDTWNYLWKGPSTLIVKYPPIVTHCQKVIHGK